MRKRKGPDELYSRSFLKKRYWKNGKSQREIANELGVSRYMVYYWMRKLDVETRDFKTAQWNEPDLTPSDDLSYILGVARGDGSTGETSYRFVLCQKEEAFAKSVEKSLKEINLNPRTYFHRGFFWTVGCSKRFYEWYKPLSLDDISDLLRNESHRKQFVRGFYESEGSNSFRREGSSNHWEISMSNSDINLLKFIRNILQSWEMNFGLYNDSAGVWKLRSFKKSRNARFLRKIEPCIRNEMWGDEIFGST